MKKFSLVLTILLSFTYLHAIDDLDLEYEKGLNSYKMNDFKTSYDIFSKLYLTKLSDAKLSFYLGRSAYETGNYEIALAAFERVDMLDSGNIRNKLEMARTYFMLKMYEESEMLFKEVLQNPNIPQNVRTNIELYLSKVTKVQEKSFTYANVNVDWLYDSNVNYGSLDSEYNVNVGTLPSTPSIADRAWQVAADMTNVYDIGEKNGFAIKNSLVAFMKQYSHETDYNIRYFSYTPSLIYSQTKYLIELAVGADVLYVGNENYLQSLAITPKYELSHSATLRSITYFKYQRKDFQKTTDKDLNSNHYELSYGLQKVLSPRSYVQGTLIGINEAKVQGSRIDVDYMEYRGNIAYANQFSALYGANVFAEYRKRDYSDYSALFGSKRADNAGTLSGEINAKILETLRFHIKGMYNRVESNQKRFSYEKYTITLGVTKTF